MEDIPSYIRHWAQTSPEKEVFVFYNEDGRTTVLNALHVYQLANRFAARLRKLGFLKGDLISSALPNSPEHVVTDFGIIIAGCIVSNLQALEKDGSDLWKAMECYKSAGIILPLHEKNSPYSMFKQFLPSTLTAPHCVDVTIPHAPSVRRIILIGRSTSDVIGLQPCSFLEDLRQDPEEISISPAAPPSSLVYVFGTSGTTGYSKMVPRTHEDILRIARTFQKSPPSKRISQKQLSWVGGFPFTFLGNSSCSVIQDCFQGKKAIGVKRYWDIIEEEKCTTGFFFPPEIDAIMRYFKVKSPPTYKLKAVITGGQPVTKKLISEALGVITEGIAVSYASTELWAVTNTFITRPDQMHDFMSGRPWQGVSVRIVNDQMEDVGVGETGILLVKSPFGVSHYYNHTPTKRLCTDDGYFITGDRAWLDQDGALYVSDRNDDAIHHGVLNVFPSWPESILAKIPGVEEAVVLGIPHGDGADKLCACIMLQPGSNVTKEELLSSYNEHFIDTRDAFFPKLTYLELLPSFPRTVSGKVNKKDLRHLIVNKILQKEFN